MANVSSYKWTSTTVVPVEPSVMQEKSVPAESASSLVKAASTIAVVAVSTYRPTEPTAVHVKQPVPLDKSVQVENANCPVNLA